MSVSQTDRPDTGEGDPPRRGHRRNRRRQFSPFVLVLALVFFFTPMVALAGGFRAHEIENRPLAKFPSIKWGLAPVPSKDGETALFSATLTSEPSSDAALANVKGPIRSTAHDAAPKGTEALVGGNALQQSHLAGLLEYRLLRFTRRPG